MSADAANTRDEVRYLPFDFRGDGTEYFKIWIVNIVLTILTLGIYSAWAKVRTKRYFYSNLYLNGTSFRYLADPVAILKGRLIAVAALVIYTVTANLFPVAGIVLMLALLMAIPYLVVRSLAFNNRMSSWRNVQFRFHGTYGEASMVLYVWPLLALLTLFILYPMALLKMNRFIVRNSAYGTVRFDFDATFGDYGKIFLLMIVGVAAVPLIAALLAPIAPPLVPVVLLVAYAAVFVYLNMALTNLYYNMTALREHGFDAHLSFGGLARTYAINFALTVLTLGLYLPAAKVRLARYIADNVEFVAVGSLSDFASAEKEHVSALGEEFGEVFDFDIGTL